MNPPIPPIDLSQVPTWLTSATTITGILVFVAWPFLQWLSNTWTWYGKTGQLGLDFGLGAFALILYWAGVLLSTLLTPNVVQALQPYYAGIPIVLGLMLALKLSRAVKVRVDMMLRAQIQERAAVTTARG